ncbi:phenylalanine N-monooxygenase [Salvia divinorum]|uniref:Phenylalanine N-monooxygenase n=1 Tax=Salvia divinorum TaxID=28513 RepID=A0ABD1I5K6_SALDI
METISKFSITTFLALCLFSLIFFKLICIKKRSAAPPPLPPGPTAFPFLGSLPQMLTKKTVSRWIHNLMQQLNTEIACIKLGSVHVISVTSPELSREFLKKHDGFLASRPDILAARLVSDGYQGLILSPSGS